MSDSTEKKISEVTEAAEPAAENTAAEQAAEKKKKPVVKKTVFEPEQKNANGLDEVIYRHYLARENAAKEAAKNGKPAAPAQIGPMYGNMDIGLMRLPDEHPTYELVDLAKDVEEKDCELKGVPYRVYTPQKAAPAGGRACIVYVHGGGFVMGGLTRLNNINRRLADVMNAVAVHVDYTLSPEAAYPTGVNECYDVIEELAGNAQAYGIDPDRIYILGDSAGGNMCVSLVLRDEELGRNLIKAQVLFYPVLDLTSYSHDTFEMEMMGEDLDPMITGKISQMWKANDGEKGVNSAYLQGFTGGEDYHVSPLLAPEEILAKMPKTIMITAEYDFLRIQCEEFVYRLEEAGADVSYYMYAGTFHGFLERVGVFAEADHSIHLVADLLR